MLTYTRTGSAHSWADPDTERQYFWSEGSRIVDIAHGTTIVDCAGIDGIAPDDLTVRRAIDHGRITVADCIRYIESKIIAGEI